MVILFSDGKIHHAEKMARDYDFIISPAERHRGEDGERLKQRDERYRQAQKVHPKREKRRRKLTKGANYLDTYCGRFSGSCTSCCYYEPASDFVTARAAK